MFAVALGLVCLLALGLRIHELGTIPNGFHVDEASIGFNARCILETGRDEHGVRFPLYFKAFGEYKNPVFIYACVPVTALFGSDVFGVRLTSALFGAATVVATGLLGAALLGRWGGVLAAFLLSLSPWHLQLSRIAFEAVSLPLFVTVAVWLLVMAERRPACWSSRPCPLPSPPTATAPRSSSCPCSSSVSSCSARGGCGSTVGQLPARSLCW